MEDQLFSTQELIAYIKSFTWKRKILQLHIHHTWKPNHSDYNGKNGFELQKAMRNYHVNTNHWKDIGQHLTLLPDGKWITGRDFNLDPASIEGWNKGAFAIEMIGNFDIGRDKFGGAQADAMFEFCAAFIVDRNLDIKTDVKFHRDNPKAGKSCPGSSINRENFFMQMAKTICLLQNPITASDEWKIKEIDYLASVGIINDPEGWKKKVNEPIPVWAAITIMSNIFKKLQNEG